MGRKAKLTEDQIIQFIRLSKRTQKELAKEFGVSLLTIWKVKNFKEAYAIKVEGTPVLDEHGREVGFVPTQSAD